MRHAFALATALAASLAAAKAAAAAPPEPELRPDGSLVIAQWNLENLYDAVDDPATTGDDAFSPGGWARWTDYRYRLKLTNIAEIVSHIRPDILCVQEVENLGVLDDLREVLDNVFSWPMPYVVHKESPDPRGQECAILSRVVPRKAKWLNPGQYLHPSPCAEFSVGGRPLLVICNHWKSRTGNPKISAAKREVQADKVRDEYRRQLGKDPSLAILVTGDFNDSMDDRIPLECGPFRTNLVQVLEEGDSLFCLSSLLPKEARSTFFYSQAKSWHSFDTMNVSRGLLPDGVPASPWQVDFASYRVYVEDKMKMGEFGAPYPTRQVGTKTGHVYHYGYSDHFPVVVTIRARDGASTNVFGAQGAQPPR